jgi:hypothetical protein
LAALRRSHAGYLRFGMATRAERMQASIDELETGA